MTKEEVRTFYRQNAQKREVWNKRNRYYHKLLEKYFSFIIPEGNERGNIENAIIRTPDFGTHQEFIFIEGNLSDNTYEEMERVRSAYPDKN